jgi:hypothetical protein
MTREQIDVNDGNYNRVKDEKDVLSKCCIHH